MSGIDLVDFPTKATTAYSSQSPDHANFTVTGYKSRQAGACGVGCEHSNDAVLMAVLCGPADPRGTFAHDPIGHRSYGSALRRGGLGVLNRVHDCESFVGISARLRW